MPNKLEDPKQRSEAAVDAVLMGPTRAASIHGISISTAKRLKKEALQTRPAEEAAMAQYLMYEKMAGVRALGAKLATAAMDRLLENGGKLLDKLGRQSPSELAKVAHDAMRCVEVTVPKINMLASLQNTDEKGVTVNFIKSEPEKETVYEVMKDPIEREEE